jgi:hypothetical protein
MSYMAGTKVEVVRSGIAPRELTYVGTILGEILNAKVMGGVESSRPKYFDRIYVVAWKGHELCVTPSEMKVVV